MTHSGIVLTARAPDEVFDLLANPEQFAPLLPNFESMAMLDPNHFSLRISIAMGEMSGHANLEMMLVEAERPAVVGYRGQGIVAGSQLNLLLQFRISPTNASTQVNWRGDFSLDGGLAFMMAGLIETMGREHFERMADRLREQVNAIEPPPDVSPPPEVGQ
jgi:carbon monoxide dehydrogenase subunit G